jgi:hypothetical protein
MDASSIPTESANRRVDDSGRRRGFIPNFPTLWPHLLVGRKAASPLPFPFEEPSIRYYFLARYGIYDVARSWGLSGKEVLFPAYFHSVELDALVAAGVQVRFYPVHKGLRVDVDEVARLIGPSSAAVYVIHYAGFPGPVEGLAALCRERGLRLIEDAALALLSQSGGRPLGSFGDAAVFCLYKTIPTPIGGAVVMPSGWAEDVAKPRPYPAIGAGARAVNLILLNLEMRGIIGTGSLRRIALRLRRRPDRPPHGLPPGSTFDRRLIGLGAGPFAPRVIEREDYPAIVERRRHNYLRLTQRLSPVLPPIFPTLPVGVCPLFYAFQTPHRQRLLDVLGRRGVEIGEFWPERHPAIAAGSFPEVDEIRRTALWLPCHQDLDDDTIDGLAAVVLEAISEIT